MSTLRQREDLLRIAAERSSVAQDELGLTPEQREAWEQDWLDKATQEEPPCAAPVPYDDGEYKCDLPAGHLGAHRAIRDGGITWYATGAQAAQMRKVLGWKE